MNNEFVMVPREMLGRALDLLDESQPGATAEFLRTLLAQPAAQHQEPVAWLYSDPDGNARDQLTSERATEEERGGWAETPLYPNADTGDVGRLEGMVAKSLDLDYQRRNEIKVLRAQLAELKEAFNESQEGLVLRGKMVADQAALLIKIRDKLQEEYWDQYAGLDESRELINSALSASAEPSAQSRKP